MLVNREVGPVEVGSEFLLSVLRWELRTGRSHSVRDTTEGSPEAVMTEMNLEKCK